MPWRTDALATGGRVSGTHLVEQGVDGRIMSLGTERHLEVVGSGRSDPGEVVTLGKSGDDGGDLLRGRSREKIEA